MQKVQIDETLGRILYPYSGPPPDPSRERTFLVAECRPWGHCLTVRDGAGGGINLPIAPPEELDGLEVTGIVAVAGGGTVDLPWSIPDDTFSEECPWVLACYREYDAAFNAYKKAVAALEAARLSADVSEVQDLCLDRDEKWSETCRAWMSLNIATDGLLSHPVYLRYRDAAAKLRTPDANS